MADDLRLRLAIEFADLQQQRNLAQRERESLRGDFQATKAGERAESIGFGQLVGSLLTAPIAGPVGAAAGSVFGKIIGGLFG